MLFFHEYYCNIKNKLNNNNKYLYLIIKNYIETNNILLTTSNYHIHRDILLDIINGDDNIFLDNLYNDILCYNILDKILQSFYNKNYNLVSSLMNKKKKIDNYYIKIINDIKTKNILDFDNKINYKKKIQDMDIELSTNINYNKKIKL